MLNVKERFVSYQGTGVNAGLQQFFVRLLGCTVPCPLRANCDQPESLAPTGGERFSVRDLTDEAIRRVGVGGWIHITGGEPAEHPDVAMLIDAASSEGLRVQVQTSGSLPIQCTSSPFFSVSPKQRKLGCKPSEIVLIACRWMTFDFAIDATDGHDCPIYVVPESVGGKFACQRMLELADSLNAAGRRVRCGLQSHLVWGVA